MPPPRSLDQFFQRLNEIKPIAWNVHPSHRTLRDYAKRNLKNSWSPSSEHFEKLLRGTLTKWTATDVRAHLLTCAHCTERLRQLRRPAGGFFVWLNALAQRTPEWVFRPAVFRAHGLLYLAATVALFLWPLANADTTSRSISPIAVLIQIFQDAPAVSWIALISLGIWGIWSLVALLHLLLLRHRGLW
jgi:hypothetical protein